jgi:hypothetical protein
MKFRGESGELGLDLIGARIDAAFVGTLVIAIDLRGEGPACDLAATANPDTTDA